MADGYAVEPGNRKTYMVGGKAKFTVVSPKGTRFTYEIRRDKRSTEDNERQYVAVLTGPNNAEDFEFLGTIFNRDRYRHGQRSKINYNAPSAKAFRWIWEHTEDPRIEVLSSGQCSVCRRELTDPESIRTGMGPTCRDKWG